MFTKTSGIFLMVGESHLDTRIQQGQAPCRIG